MSIIISKQHKNAQRLERSSFQLEDHLQEYIYNNPDSIPLYDIDEDIRLLILAREFSTSSGPIDALGVDQNGNIYLIETKLYKNADKRTVVAQVLDYGASLWKQYDDSNAFMSELNTYVSEKFDQSLVEKLQTFFQLKQDDVSQLINSLQNNLQEGNFKFVVLMDQIEGRLKDLILFINQNSKFTVYGVELDYYKHESFEILIPRLYGSEIKKDVTPTKSSRIRVSDDEIINAYSKAGYEKQILEWRDVFDTLQGNQIEGVLPNRTSKNYYFNIIGKNNDKIMSVVLGLDRNEVSESISVWLSNVQWYRTNKEKIDALFRTHMSTVEISEVPENAQLLIVARWPLKTFSANKLEGFFKALSALIYT